jgi:hypothetical protein
MSAKSRQNSERGEGDGDWEQETEAQLKRVVETGKGIHRIVARCANHTQLS